MTDARRVLPETQRPVSCTVSCTVRLLSLPTVDQLAAAHDPDPATDRELTIVELVDDEGRSGFGECSALTQPGYSDEWARGAFALLTGSTLRTELNALKAPMAAAGVEMALLDLDLQRRGESLVHRLAATSTAGATTLSPFPPTTIPAGIVLPLGSIDDTIAAAVGWVSRGITRLKLKIVPGQITDHVIGVHRACPGIELHVDANQSCTSEHLAELASLADHGVTVIEQPFAVDDPTSSAELVRATTALVMADESATDLAAILELIERAAVTGIVIKPSRLGGLAAAVEVHDACVEAGVGVSAGGMLESGLGRHALAALASLPGFTIVGDLSPARRWLADDPFDDLVMVNGRITVPTGAGVAPAPDPDLLDRFTIEQASFEWPIDR